MKRLLSLFLVLLATLLSAHADAPPAPPPPPVGIIIQKALPGYEASATWFTSIQWVDKDSGYVVDSTGNKIPFLNDAVGRIIYFDEGYYDEIDHNQYWIDWRIVVRDREVVLSPIKPKLLLPGDVAHLGSEQATLEDVIERYPNGASIVQPLIDTLKDQINKLNSGLVFQDGKWIAAKDVVDSSSDVPMIGDSAALISFTTTDGKRFENARVTATDSGLSVLTSDGGASISFDRVPQDISVFPKNVQDKINAYRAEGARLASEATPPPSSTSSMWTSALSWIEATYHAVVSYFYPPTSPVPSSPSTTNSSAASSPSK